MNSVVHMGFAMQPYVIRNALGGGMLAGGRISGIYVTGHTFEMPLYDASGTKLSTVDCSPSFR
jgi:hypothetical protein